MAFCFTAALEISLQYVHNQFHLPLSFHVLSFLVMLTSSLLFVAKFIGLKFILGNATPTTLSHKLLLQP
ncbi:hypothetical protein Patl1_26492 [Pistacia atlantica]|uniref:Uncharacterized protein n=1 Tax=Pistacia atlantica TaxID=434234 RepID=A0ACC1B085_9ROSI|nr:hypothetical protein Patl1_26492 [Pistacia atlantica]